jgi:hypothetical protein
MFGKTTVEEFIPSATLPADFPRVINVPKLPSLTAQSVNIRPLTSIAHALDTYIPEPCRVYGCRVWVETIHFVKSSETLDVFALQITHNKHETRMLRMLVSHKVVLAADPTLLLDDIGGKFAYAIRQIHDEEFFTPTGAIEDADAAYEAWQRDEIQEDDSEGPWTKSKVAPPKPGSMGVQVSPGLPPERRTETTVLKDIVTSLQGVELSREAADTLHKLIEERVRLLRE